MKWFWAVACIVVAGIISYYYYNAASKPKAPVSHEMHETKAILMSKTRDHEALWVHYSYKDMAGDSHEMSEKVPYIDLWEGFKIGQQVDIYYNDDGLSALKLPNRHLQ